MNQFEDKWLKEIEMLFGICRNCEVELRATDFTLCGWSEEEAELRYKRDAFDEVWCQLQRISYEVGKMKNNKPA